MLNLFRKVSLLGLLATFLLAPVSFAETSSPVLDRVIDFKVLKVGVSGNQPPLNTNSRSGKLIGYEVDLARALAGAMGARLEIITMPWMRYRNGRPIEALRPWSSTCARASEMSYACPLRETPGGTAQTLNGANVSPNKLIIWRRFINT